METPLSLPFLLIVFHLVSKVFVIKLVNINPPSMLTLVQVAMTYASFTRRLFYLSHKQTIILLQQNKYQPTGKRYIYHKSMLFFATPRLCFHPSYSNNNK